MENVKLWTLTNERAELIINGVLVRGTVEHYRGSLMIKADNGAWYNPNRL